MLPVQRRSNVKADDTIKAKNNYITQYIPIANMKYESFSMRAGN